MPKSQLIDPSKVRKKTEIPFCPILCNQYEKTFAEEQRQYTKEELLGIYRDMVYIRQIETMLLHIKENGCHHTTRYHYPGPSHLCIGQEAAVVGQAFCLSPEDMIFGSHRNHGDVLAKGLSAIRKIDEQTLCRIMEEFDGGNLLRVIETHFPADQIQETARRFLAYGLTSEIFGKGTGFNKGLGGSMHVFFPAFGSYPNNAIVGGSATIGAGAALYKKINKKDGIVAVNIGDGALGRGPVWEAMIFSAMEQYTALWDEEFHGGLPVLFTVFNNFYGMGGQTSGETMPPQITVKAGAAIGAEQMHAEQVDGYNPLAVIDAVQRKKEQIIQKKGPALLDILTYRTTGHSASDAGSYRTEEEIERWRQADSIVSFGNRLKENHIAGAAELEEINRQSAELADKVCALAADDNISPRIFTGAASKKIETLLFSNEKHRAFETRPETLLPYKTDPRSKQLEKKQRKAVQGISPEHSVTIRDALFEAIRDKYYSDPTFISYSEELRDWGGTNGVYEGLTEAIPYHRLFNSPISESAIVGSAVGYAISGGSVCAEIMFGDFIGCAADEIFNQMAKWQEMSGGLLRMPLVLRVSVGFKYGAQHSQDWTALTTHIPGLKVVFPATPYDAKGLMNKALAGNDPVVFFESQRLYSQNEYFEKTGVPEDYYEIPFGEPAVRKEGNDVTILSLGSTLYEALDAVNELEKHGVSAELIDARSLVPFNYDAVIRSVKKTGKILLVSHAAERNSFLKEMAANITEFAFGSLRKPPVVIGTRNWVTPGHELEEEFFPNASWILDAVHERLCEIPGYTPARDFTLEEKLRRCKKGV